MEVLVVPVDESWELWLRERGERLTLGGTVAIDDAVFAWRDGDDPILRMAEHIRTRMENGEPDLGYRA